MVPRAPRRLSDSRCAVALSPATAADRAAPSPLPPSPCAGPARTSPAPAGRTFRQVRLRKRLDRTAQLALIATAAAAAARFAAAAVEAAAAALWQSGAGP